MVSRASSRFLNYAIAICVLSEEAISFQPRIAGPLPEGKRNDGRLSLDQVLLSRLRNIKRGVLRFCPDFGHQSRLPQDPLLSWDKALVRLAEDEAQD